MSGANSGGQPDNSSGPEVNSDKSVGQSTAKFVWKKGMSLSRFIRENGEFAGQLFDGGHNWTTPVLRCACEALGYRGKSVAPYISTLRNKDRVLPHPEKSQKVLSETQRQRVLSLLPQGLAVQVEAGAVDGEVDSSVELGVVEVPDAGELLQEVDGHLTGLTRGLRAMKAELARLRRDNAKLRARLDLLEELQSVVAKLKSAR